MPKPLRSLYEALDAADTWHRTLTLKRGEYVVRSGQVDRRLYYVESGTLIFGIELEGQEQCLRFGYRGDFIGALDSYLQGEPTAYFLRALRACKLRVVEYDCFHRFLAADAHHRALWQNLMSWMIHGQLEREIDLIIASPEERYRRVLARSPRLFQEVPAKYIANYLRMSPETLSRLKKS